MMEKVKLELWRIPNHIKGYGIIIEPPHDVNKTIFDFCNENKVNYCFHDISYEETSYNDGRFIKSGPWHGTQYESQKFKLSHEYFAGCELAPEKIKKPWKFGDYIKYVTVYYQ
jgi:hypothetical protein